MGVVPKDRFKNAIEKRGYRATDQFSQAARDAATLFFDENSVDEETECLRRVKKPFYMKIPVFLARTGC